MKTLDYNQSLLTAESLRLNLLFNATSGEFYWRTPKSGRRISKKAGNIHKSSGYLRISLTINGTRCLFQAHRLAWLYVYGVWPKMDLDHIDRNKINNSIKNLRECTQVQNSRNPTKRANATSRYIGVCWNNKLKKWKASIRINGNKDYYLGSFKSEEEAATAYNKAALERDQNFNNLNLL